MMMEDGMLKAMQPSTTAGDNSALGDTLLLQLNNGELRTQVVKWQNACYNMHQALR